MGKSGQGEIQTEMSILKLHWLCWRMRMQLMLDPFFHAWGLVPRSAVKSEEKTGPELDYLSLPLLLPRPIYFTSTYLFSPLPFTLSLPLPLPLPTYLYLYLYLYLSIFTSTFISTYLSLPLLLSLPIYFYLYLYLKLSVFTSTFTSISLYFPIPLLFCLYGLPLLLPLYSLLP